MNYKLVVPSTADGALSVTILKWLRKAGDQVTKGEDVVQASTEKITLYVPAPADGTLTEILVSEGTKVNVGDALGTIEGS
jgi:pyruvate/2-oxoglutarate dehydrogenase complex dihydrolipoamide acyltransferase (E2) component